MHALVQLSQNNVISVLQHNSLAVLSCQAALHRQLCGFASISWLRELSTKHVPPSTKSPTTEMMVMLLVWMTRTLLASGCQGLLMVMGFGPDGQHCSAADCFQKQSAAA
jgi:hypothetical protein